MIPARYPALAAAVAALSVGGGVAFVAFGGQCALLKVVFEVNELLKVDDDDGLSLQLVG